MRLILLACSLLLGFATTPLAIHGQANGADAPNKNPTRRAPSAHQRVAKWMQQYETKRQGELPKSFCVRIHFDGSLTKRTKKGPYAFRPREVYEFTPHEIRRLCIRVELDEKGVRRYRTDPRGGYAYEVATRKPFGRIDEVCRILLALDYLDLVREDNDAAEQNLHHLQVMTDSGLDAIGVAGIDVRGEGLELSYHETCLGAGMSTSAQSIRFAALYHTLRRLARSEFSLSNCDWDDALDEIDVDKAVRRSQGRRLPN